MSKRRALLLYLASSFIIAFGASIIRPIHPYFVLSLQIDMKTYGMLGTLARLIGLALEVPLSALVPAVGYFKAYALSTSILVLTRSLYAASALRGGDLALFALGYVTAAVQMRMVRIQRMSVVPKLVGSERRGTTFGLVSSLMMLAGTLGPLAGGFLRDVLGLDYARIFVTSALLILASAPLLAALVGYDRTMGSLPTPAAEFKRQVKALVTLARERKFLGALLVLSLDTFTWSMTHDFTEIYVARDVGASASELALAGALTSAVTIVLSFAVGLVSDTLKTRPPFLALSEVAGIAFFFLLMAARDMLLVYVAYALMGLVIALWSPVFPAYVTELAEDIDPSLVPMSVGVLGLIRSVVALPAPLIGGYLFDIAPKSLFTTVVALLVAETLLLLGLPRPRRKA